MNNKCKQLEQLTSLRGLFILLIVLFHANGYFTINYHEPFKSLILDAQFFGNYFFFILSGFLISLSYGERIAQNQISLLEYVQKRVKKLYPLYIITNIIVLGIYTLQRGFLASFNLKYGIEVALMMSRGWINDVVPYNYPTWFINVLLLCYIVYFFVERLNDNHNNVYCFVVVFLIIWGYLLMQKSWNVPFCYVVDGEGLCCFFTGVLLKEMLMYIKNKQKTVKIVSFAGLAMLLFIIAGSIVYSFKTFADDIRIVIILIICPLVIFYALYNKMVERILCSKPLVAFGKISMSVFYWHVPLLMGIKYLRDDMNLLGDISMFTQFVVFLVLLALVSTASYYVFEKKKNT